MSMRSLTLVTNQSKSSFTPVSTGLLQRKCACGDAAGLTGKCNECNDKRFTLQCHSNHQTEPKAVPPTVHEVLRESGQPLDSETRTFMESRFGHDFSQIQVSNEASDDLEATSESESGSALPLAPPSSLQTPPPVPAITCAQPINWNHRNPRDHGADAIRIDISWQSSTGNLADLSNCEVREVVNYDPIPNPPFLWNPPNPTILTVPGKNGSAIDTHSYPPGLRNGITNPREAGTMTANQVYQFRCTAPGCTGNWTDFPGQSYSIRREVFEELVRPNPWRYRITKTGTGAGNTFNYSRAVEIPEP